MSTQFLPETKVARCDHVLCLCTDCGAITAHRVKCLRWRDGAYEDLYTCAVCEAMHWVDGVEEAD